MTARKEYTRYACNYFVTDLSAPHSPLPPYNGAGWSIDFEPLEYIGQDSSSYVTHYGDHQEAAKVVVIQAQNYVRAIAASRMIHAALCMLDGNTAMWEFLSYDALIPYTPGVPIPDLDPMLEKEMKQKSICRSNVPLACYIAAKASRRRSLVYAMFKLYHSYKQHSTHHIDLDPGSDMLPRSLMAEDHVAFATAVTLAYGVIEELQLEVRASSQRPSRDKAGIWTPQVKRDLETRLISAGVDLSEPVCWQIRGPRTRLERGKRTTPLGKSPWSWGMVRDIDIQVIDAIADLSWMRSEISAHRFAGKKEGELVSLLSPYEVANAQYLARRLLMESLGVWRVF